MNGLHTSFRRTLAASIYLLVIAGWLVSLNSLAVAAEPTIGTEATVAQTGPASGLEHAAFSLDEVRESLRDETRAELVRRLNVSLDREDLKADQVAAVRTGTPGRRFSRSLN